jgi:hypothetical protein
MMYKNLSPSILLFVGFTVVDFEVMPLSCVHTYFMSLP